MITIYAEKPDVGNKIAAALDKITLASGKEVLFSDLKKYEKEVKSQGTKDGYFRISFDGEETFVTWGFGHLCELKQAKDYDSAYQNWNNITLPFIPQKYEIKPRAIPDNKDIYGYNEKVKRQLACVSKLFSKSRLIINATDFDREGEVIFSYVYELVCGKAPIKRACFSSQTKDGIYDGFHKDIKDGKEMVKTESAGRMRSIADWAVGANLTVAMTKWGSRESGILSIGRVQTPTLRMLVDREKAIKGFTSAKYYVLEALFTTKTKETFKGKYSKEKFEDKKEAENILKRLGDTGKVVKIDDKTVHKTPPSLYSLSSLQMECNSRFGFSLKKTLDLVQSLYDNGHVTYPRSDSSFLTEDMEPVVNRVLNALTKVSEYASYIAGKPRAFVKSRYFNNAKVGSHFAIIPTEMTPKKLSDDEQKVYDLIAKSVIQMIYPEAILLQRKVSVDVNGEIFYAQETRIIEKGFLEVENTVKENILPAVLVGEMLSGKYNLIEKDSEPPKRYTEKTLLAAMISCGKDLDDEDLRKVLLDPTVGGIGTVATRDAIIETLVQREYIARSGKSLCATEKGISLIDTLPVSDVKSPEMTAKWEQRLNAIATGKEDADVFLKDIEKTISEWCSYFSGKAPSTFNTATGKIFAGKSVAFMCPICGKPLSRKTWGISCSGYKDGCKFSVGQTIAGKKITDAQIEKLLKTGITTKITGFTNKAGKKFDAQLTIKGGKVSFVFDH